MSLDVRTAQNTLEMLLLDVILYGLGSPADVQPSQAIPPGVSKNFLQQLRFAPTVGGDSTTLDQANAGLVKNVMVLDRSLSQSEIVALLRGQVPSVVIEAHGDDPKDATLNVGHRWISTYEFTITVISQNLRDARQAAQGSPTEDPGANLLDGLIIALLAGTTLNAAFDNDSPIQEVRIGRAENRYTEMGQRRVWRSRDYQIVASVELPAAPNDTGPLTDIDTQAELVKLAASSPVPVTNPPSADVVPAYDPNNYLMGGCAPTLGGALTQALSAGSAVIAGATVNYAGGSVTFSAYSDNYRDLTPDGAMHIVPVPVGGGAPPVTANALRIGYTTTNASTVLGDAILAQMQAPLGPTFDFQV